MLESRRPPFDSEERREPLWLLGAVGASYGVLGFDSFRGCPPSGEREGTLFLGSEEYGCILGSMLEVLGNIC